MKYLSSTSRNLDPANYAWDSVVHQFGRPLLDSELNLSQDILKQKIDLPSGVLANQTQRNEGSFLFHDPFTGNSPNKIVNADFRANTLTFQKFSAVVNGMLVEVKGTNSTDSNLNHVELSTPEEQGKLVDFVFLEVWRKEVTPSMGAKARLRISSPLANDTISFDNNVDTVTLTAGIDFQISNSSPETARNLSDAINNYDGQGLGLTIGTVTVTSETRGTQYLFLSLSGGADGNAPSFNITPNSTGITVVGVASGGSDGEGKPNANSIYYAGNLDCHSDLFLDDDIQDPNLNVSSSRRVQVQYRLRVHQIFNYDISQEIFGFTHFSLLAQGPQSNPVNNFTFSRHSEDNGLWYSGTGSEADAESLGTVDGYIYAIPIAFVYRRNKPANDTDGFQPLDRYNTGTLHDHDGNTLVGNIYVDNVPATDSDRPDGLFADQIASEDVLDLRRRVFTSLDLTSELTYQYQSLLDGLNKTWIAEAHNLADTGNGTAGISHTPLMCDVFGDSTNTLNIGQHKRDFNHVSRRFSNVPVVERFFLKVIPGIGLNPQGVTWNQTSFFSAGWHEGDSIEIDISQMDPNSDIDWVSINVPTNGISLPQGSKITDIGLCWHNDGNYATQISQEVLFSRVSGLGTDVLTLTLAENSLTADGGLLGSLGYSLVSGDPASPGSEEEVYIEIIVETPAGDYGLTGRYYEESVAHEGVYPTGSCISLNDPESAVNLYPNTGNGVVSPIINFREGKREVTLEYVYGAQTINVVSHTPNYCYLPQRIYGDDSTISITDVSDPLNPVVLNLDHNNSNFSHSEPKIAWFGGWVAGQRRLEITYHPIVPYHATNTLSNTIFVFYKRQAPQTCGSDFPIAQANISSNNGGVVPVEMELQPLAVGDKITSMLNSDFTYPFVSPTEHLASAPNAEANSGYDEYVVLNSNEVFLDDLTINTGSVELSTLVPYASTVNITLGSTATPPSKDGYNRASYQTMVSSSYFPASYAKNLSVFSKGYKNVLPSLMKVVTDNHDLYRRGEVVLVLFIKTSTWDQSVSVDMRDNINNNLVVACVYRTRNLILLGE